MPSGTLLTGKRFGSLTVGRELRCDVYRCTCKCGEKLDVFRSQLTKGSIRHCGCKYSKRHSWQRKKPSFGHHRTYKGRDGKLHQRASSELLSWLAMKGRCLYKTTPDYTNWGARGISICPRWLEPQAKGFRNFIEDMGPRPIGKTLDRKNPNGHYEPSNCRWADSDTQGQNRRFVLEANGIEVPQVVPMDDLDENPFVCG